MSVLFRTEQLRYTHPEAWQALPEPYKEDDCLVFWESDDGSLWATADESQVFAIGDGEYVFDVKEGWLNSSLVESETETSLR